MSSHLRLGLPSHFFHSGFATKLHISPTYETSPNHLLPHDLIFGEAYKLPSSLVRNLDEPASKRWYPTTLHGVTIQKTVTWIVIAVRTSNLAAVVCSSEQVLIQKRTARQKYHTLASSLYRDLCLFSLLAKRSVRWSYSYL